jgi:hypothetical protein
MEALGDGCGERTEGGLGRIGAAGDRPPGRQRPTAPQAKTPLTGAPEGAMPRPLAYVPPAPRRSRGF